MLSAQARPQEWPQPPQLSLSVRMSTHARPQSEKRGPPQLVSASTLFDESVRSGRAMPELALDTTGRGPVPRVEAGASLDRFAAGVHAWPPMPLSAMPVNSIMGLVVLCQFIGYDEVPGGVSDAAPVESGLEPPVESEAPGSTPGANDMHGAWPIDCCWNWFTMASMIDWMSSLGIFGCGFRRIVIDAVASSTTPNCKSKRGVEAAGKAVFTDSSAWLIVSAEAGVPAAGLDPGGDEAGGGCEGGGSDGGMETPYAWGAGEDKAPL